MVKVAGPASTSSGTGASREDIVALRRLIDYAIDEAERNGLFSCARLLKTARDELEDGEDGAVDVYARYLEGRTHLPS